MLTAEKLLERSASTAQVLSHTRLLMRLHHCFQAILPSGLAEYAKVANYRSGVIIIHTTNSATASKLKQMSVRIRESIEKIGLECNGVEIKVQPAFQVHPQISPTLKPISATGAKAIAEQLSRMPQDTPLAHALKNLLARALINEVSAPETSGQTTTGQK